VELSVLLLTQTMTRDIPIAIGKRTIKQVTLLTGILVPTSVLPAKQKRVAAD
jgi:hypothetical protein